MSVSEGKSLGGTSGKEPHSLPTSCAAPASRCDVGTSTKVKMWVAMLGSILACAASSGEPPTGWRLPTAKELAGEPLRARSPTMNAEVTGDFNGDGKLDHAYLFKATDVSGEGLVVWISTPGGYHWAVIDKTDWGRKFPNVDLSMGIDALAPGDYRTACGKGYWECGPDEPETLRLKVPGILHFRFESAESVWYRDQAISSFRNVSLSD